VRGNKTKNQKLKTKKTDKNAKLLPGCFGPGISVFTLTLILSHSPYPSGNKSSLDACPPFLPRERKKELYSLPWRERVRVRENKTKNQKLKTKKTDKNAKLLPGCFGPGISVFTLTLILSHSPYPSGNKSSLDACPPFLPRERKKESTDYCSDHAISV
jgi:hypothetical protein